MRLLLADDHGLFRDSMAVWLKQLEGDLWIDFANSLASVSHALKCGAYDLVMMDLGMPGMQGVVSVKEVCIHAGVTPLLVVSADDSARVIHGCFEAGAAGYVTKSSPGEQILQAVQQVLAGERCFPKVGHELPALALSDKQKQILAYLAQGHSNRVIAEKMFLSEGTVKQYVTKILQALNVDNRVQAGLKAKALLGMGDG